MARKKKDAEIGEPEVDMEETEEEETVEEEIPPTPDPGAEGIAKAAAEEAKSVLFYNKQSDGMRLRMMDLGIDIKFERGYYKATKSSEIKAIRNSTKYKKGWIVEVPAGSDVGVAMQRGPVTTTQRSEQKP